MPSSSPCRLALLAVTLLAMSAAPLRSAAEPPDWRTRAEATDYRETARYEETAEYCRRLAAAHPEAIHLQSLGRSPEGRDVLALVVSTAGHFTPEAARGAGEEVVFVNACIHPGECEGKDAGLALLRDLLVHGENARDPILDGTTLLFVPIHGVDGHERFGPFHRINQLGPTGGQGWRTTAQNLNLNRDWMKADAPEMRAVLGLWRAWQPDLLIDSHTTDGADYQYDLTWSLATHADQHPAVAAWQREAFEGHIFPALENRGHKLAPYVVLKNPADPREGFEDGAAPPRFSTGYAAVRNRAGLLVETHSLKDYRTRVVATYDLLRATLEYLHAHPGALARATRQADEDTAARRLPQPFPLGFKVGPGSVPFPFRGYAYTRTLSPVSGLPTIRFDAARPETWTVPFFNDLQPARTVTPPRFGYVVPAAWTVVLERLREHGIAWTTLAQPLTAEVETYEFSRVEWEAMPFENHHAIKEMEAKPVRRRMEFPAGSAVVDLAQPAAKVIVHLLEPDGPDSLLRWGYLDAIFEQKEYADDYLMEPMARELLAKEPAPAAEFEKRLMADAKFARDPAARLDFFYQRTPYWDERLNVYPVGRLDAAPGK